MQTFSEENYLKAIFHLSGTDKKPVSTNALAEKMKTKASSATDMVKRLSEKNLVEHTPYQGVTLTESGISSAVQIIRKHRLWEVFLVDKLEFKWDEVHDLAEELEHINSPLLAERLDAFLGYPKTDPHGDPIPDKHGNFEEYKMFPLNKLNKAETGIITGVSEHSTAFLKHLEKLGLTLGKDIEIIDILEFDGSIELKIDGNHQTVSREISKHILISK